MKTKAIHIILSLFFSAIFMFAGTGYNLIRYCCDDCRNTGIWKVEEMSCEIVHDQHHHSCCGSGYSQTVPAPKSCVNEMNKGCDIDRLTVDVPSVQSSESEALNYSLIYSQLSDYQIDVISYSSFTSDPVSHHTPPDISFPQAGRYILSKISVLII